MNRRLLIRTSAVMAFSYIPWAARANASAYQCAMNEFSSEEEREGAVAATMPDNLMRVPCKATRWWDNVDKVDLLVFELPDGRRITEHGDEFVEMGSMLPLTFDSGEHEKDALCAVIYAPNEEFTEIVDVGLWPGVQLKPGENMALTQSCLASIV